MSVVYCLLSVVRCPLIPLRGLFLLRTSAIQVNLIALALASVVRRSRPLLQLRLYSRQRFLPVGIKREGCEFCAFLNVSVNSFFVSISE